MDRKKVRAGALARLKTRIAELERDVLRDARLRRAPQDGAVLHPEEPSRSEGVTKGGVFWPGLAAARGVLHEMRGHDWRDAPAAIGFALAVATILSEAKGTLVLIERENEAREGVLSARGLAAFGFDPSRALFVRVRTDKDALFAAEEAARARDVAAALLILKGKTQRLTLAASRRLHLAAKRSGATPMIVRVKAPFEATAATMRWRIESAPSSSAPLDARVAGAPRFRVAIEKAASACRLAAGESFLVEWRHDEKRFVLLRGIEENAPNSRPYLPGDFRRPLPAADKHERIAARAS